MFYFIRVIRSFYLHIFFCSSHMVNKSMFPFIQSLSRRMLWSFDPILMSYVCGRKYPLLDLELIYWISYGYCPLSYLVTKSLPTFWVFLICSIYGHSNIHKIISSRPICEYIVIKFHSLCNRIHGISAISVSRTFLFIRSFRDFPVTVSNNDPCNISYHSFRKMEYLCSWPTIFFSEVSK